MLLKDQSQSKIVPANQVLRKSKENAMCVNKIRYIILKMEIVNAQKMDSK